MKNIESRIKRIEDKLSINKEPIIVGVIFFGDGDLPPEKTENNIITRHIRYSEFKARGQC